MRGPRQPLSQGRGPERTSPSSTPSPEAPFNPRQDKALPEGGWARWHLPSPAEDKQGAGEAGGGVGWQAGGPEGQTHAPVWLEPCQAYDRHLGTRSWGVGPGSSPQTRPGPGGSAGHPEALDGGVQAPTPACRRARPKEHLRAALISEQRLRAQL